MELADAGAELSARCDVLRSGVKRRQLQRERQLAARHAALEAATSLKASYTDVISDFRGGKFKSGTDGASAANKSLRRIGRHVDDLLRFLEASAGLQTSGDSPRSLCPSHSDPDGEMEGEPRLPESVMMAFVASHARSPSGARHADLVATEKDKLATLRRKLHESNESHTGEIRELEAQRRRCVAQIEECEHQIQAEREDAAESCAALKHRLGSVVVREQEVQMGAVAEIQHQLQAHLHELGRLVRERAELLVRRSRAAESGAEPRHNIAGYAALDHRQMPDAVAADGLLTERLRLKEKEVQELRSRAAAARSRYDKLVAEVGG